mmetsp:Transcript_94778/g.253541  ORF Transcript_94778/g.253541 Transcript_94778/m.253541 type:complete len:275 (-) Transcript_94778:927-1751(-)
MVVRSDGRNVSMMPIAIRNCAGMNRKLVYIVGHALRHVWDVFNALAEIVDVLCSCAIYVHDHDQHDALQNVQVVMQPISENNSLHACQTEDRPRTHGKSMRSRSEQSRQRWIDHRASAQPERETAWKPIDLQRNLHVVVADQALWYFAHESREYQSRLHAKDGSPRRFPVAEMTPYLEQELTPAEQLRKDILPERNRGPDLENHLCTASMTFLNRLSHASQQVATASQVRNEWVTDVAETLDQAVQSFETNHDRQHPTACVCLRDGFAMDICSQ